MQECIGGAERGEGEGVKFTEKLLKNRQQKINPIFTIRWEGGARELDLTSHPPPEKKTIQ